MQKPQRSIQAWLKDEVQSLFKLTLYFGIWFSALSLLLHEAHGRTGLPLEALGLAWLKALLAAKFMLFGQIVWPIQGVTQRRIWRVILPRSIVYTLFVVGLTLIERGILGLVNGVSFWDGMTANSSPGLVASIAWVCWLIIVPFLAIEALLDQPSDDSSTAH